MAAAARPGTRTAACCCSSAARRVALDVHSWSHLRSVQVRGGHSAHLLSDQSVHSGPLSRRQRVDVGKRVYKLLAAPPASCFAVRRTVECKGLRHPGQHTRVEAPVLAESPFRQAAGGSLLTRSSGSSLCTRHQCGHPMGVQGVWALWTGVQAGVPSRVGLECDLGQRSMLTSL